MGLRSFVAKVISTALSWAWVPKAALDRLPTYAPPELLITGVFS